jgi:hypothetical protein
VKTLVAVGHSKDRAYTMEITHAFPLSDDWYARNGAVALDAECLCDGSDDGYYRCTYPPCVAESEREQAYYGAQFAAAQFAAAQGGYEPTDPKNAEYVDDLLEMVDAR